MFDLFNRPRIQLVEETLALLSPAAEAAGLRVERDRSFFRYAASIEGALPGAYLHLLINIPSAFVSSLPDGPKVALELRFLQPLPAPLKLKPAGLFGGRSSGLSTGDQGFDDTFVLQADAPILALRLLTPETRHLLLALFRASDKLLLTEDALRWSGDEYAARALTDLFPPLEALAAHVRDLASQPPATP